MARARRINSFLNEARRINSFLYGQSEADKFLPSWSEADKFLSSWSEADKFRKTKHFQVRAENLTFKPNLDLVQNMICFIKQTNKQFMLLGVIISIYNDAALYHITEFKVILYYDLKKYKGRFALVFQNYLLLLNHYFYHFNTLPQLTVSSAWILGPMHLIL